MPSFLPHMPRAYFPRADAMAGNMMTPGGVMSGLTDLTSAIVQAPIQRQEMEASRENAQFDRQYKLDNMKFMRDREHMESQRAASREHGDTQRATAREQGENTRHGESLKNQRDVAEIQAAARRYGADKTLAGAGVRAAAKNASGMTPGLSAQQERSLRRAGEDANLDLYGDESGPSSMIPVMDTWGEPVIGPDGQPAMRRAPRDLTPEERAAFTTKRDEYAKTRYGFMPVAPPPVQPQHQPEQDASGAPPAQVQAGSTSMTPQAAPAAPAQGQGKIVTRAEIEQKIASDPNYAGYTVDELAAYYQTQGATVQ